MELRHRKATLECRKAEEASRDRPPRTNDASEGQQLCFSIAVAKGASIMFLRPILPLVVVFVLLTGCGEQSSPTAPPPNGPVITASIVKGASSMTTEAFAPSPVEIPAGTTVTWINDDQTVHTSTSNAGVWSSPALIPGGRFSFTFQSPGTFTYRCAIHPKMSGTVTVR